MKMIEKYSQNIKKEFKYLREISFRNIQVLFNT
jgi:hypothetical protein